jgi:hypothetical protein
MKKTEARFCKEITKISSSDMEINGIVKNQKYNIDTILEVT